ncbi:MAG: cell division protein FtsZ [Alphaproteobacteria bacterium]|nr:cell division protein FtsZ [Alphaproteobacteria bacterium]
MQFSADATEASSVPEPRITVIGVGGAGGNAINNMIRADLEGVEFVVANTDAQALQQSLCERQIQLGAALTKGLGAGSRSEIGQAAAEEANEAIINALKGANMAFITAGMGGGTGTGGAPVIARAAREEGVLTVGVVTKPFQFEGAHRMRQADAGISELEKYVDTLIVIQNQNLFRIAEEKTTFADAFRLADEVLHSGVRGVTDLMVLPGLVNLDFADIRSIMADMGKAVMGTGEAEGDNRALKAAEAAISNPLLDDVSMSGARSVLINITGGLDLMLIEVDEAANRIHEEVDPDANIIFGSAFSENLNGKIRVSVIATGNDVEAKDRSTPKSGRPFVGAHTENRDVKPAAQVRASDAEEQAAAPEEPLTLRLVSTLPTNDKEPDPSTIDLQQQDETPALPAAISVEPTVPPLATGLSTKADDTQSNWGTDEETVMEGDLPSFLARPSELAAETLPEQDVTAQSDAAPARPSSPIPMRKIITALKPKFQRPAKQIKSESTLEAFENNPMQEETAKAVAEKMHYVVWKVELGARIFTVPEGKVASIREQPFADRLKLFDNLENAKAEVNAIFERVAAERTAKGLPRSNLDPTLNDIMGWEEDKIPRYPF